MKQYWIPVPMNLEGKERVRHSASDFYHKVEISGINWAKYNHKPRQVRWTLLFHAEKKNSQCEAEDEAVLPDHTSPTQLQNWKVARLTVVAICWINLYNGWKICEKFNVSLCYKFHYCLPLRVLQVWWINISMSTKNLDSKSLNLHRNGVVIPPRFTPS